MDPTKHGPKAKSARKNTSYDKFRREELAKIHIGKKWALENKPGFNQEAYEAIILEASNGRTATSADLNGIERQAVIRRFKELGWKDKPAAKAKATRRPADDPQSVMLRALWIQLHQAGKVKDSSEKALANFGKRLTGIDDIGWYGNRDVTVVKKALKDWLER